MVIIKMRRHFWPIILLSAILIITTLIIQFSEEISGFSVTEVLKKTQKTTTDMSSSLVTTQYTLAIGQSLNIKGIDKP